MPGFKYDGRSRPTNDLYSKNYDEIFGNKKRSKTPSDKNTTSKTEDRGKGVTICKAKDCNNSLYGWTSSKNKEYCVDCV